MHFWVLMYLKEDFAASKDLRNANFNLTFYFQNYFTALVYVSLGKHPSRSDVQDIGSIQCYNLLNARKDKNWILCHCFLYGGNTHILAEVRLTMKSCSCILSLWTMSLSSSYLLI